MRRILLLLCVLFGVGVGQGRAHVGAPDVYVKATAGPYQVLVSVHPPATVPGAAGVDVRTDDPGVRVVGVALPGGASQGLQRFSAEQIFTGSVWVASGGAWRVTIHVSGDKGEAETTVPVPGVSDTATGLRRFDRPQWWVLGLAVVLCGALLSFRRSGAIEIAGWAALAIIFGAAVMLALKTPSAAAPAMQVTMPADGKMQLELPGRMDDLVEDHGHLMHLFAVREPEMDVMLHLHPAQGAGSRFEVALPSMAPGAFRLYADVVHRDGRLETFTAVAGLPVAVGRVLRGDDSVGVVPGLARAQVATGPGASSIRLMDGYTMTLDLASVLLPRSGQLLRFSLLDPAGQKPTDMQPYMGMTAHAAVIKTDGTVFAHIHPAGTIPMAAYGSSMAGMELAAEPSSEASFPFGFPAAGTYRVFVQMKHGGVVETGAFDLLVR